MTKNSPSANPDTTLDKLLNGRFAVEQPKKGYRIAVDTLLLASAVPATGAEKVLELGCGVGGAMLALATRLTQVDVTGIEIQPQMVALCASNIALNAFQDRLRVVEGDVAALPPDTGGVFHHVMMNPPYHDAGRHIASANPSKKRANTDEVGDLALWIGAAFGALNPTGCLTIIHRSDRQDEIAALAEQAGFAAVQIKPIWSKEDGTCKRVIIRAHKSVGKAGCFVLPPFILYGTNGRYSAAGDAILREAEGMPF